MPVSQRVKLSGGYEWKKKKKKKKKRNVWRHTRGKPRRTAALSCGTPSWRSGEEVLHHPPCAAWQSGGETWLLPGVVLSLGLWTHHSRNITGTKKFCFQPRASLCFLPVRAWLCVCVTVSVCFAGLSLSESWLFAARFVVYVFISMHASSVMSA